MTMKCVSFSGLARNWKFGCLVLAIFSFSPAFAEPPLQPAYKATASTKASFAQAVEKDYTAQCRKTKNWDGATCAQELSGLVTYYYGRKNYKKAASLAEQFRKEKIRGAGWAPCYFMQFGNGDNKNIYRFEYYQAMYAIRLASGAPRLPSSDLKAFLCAAFESSPRHLNKGGMGRDRFKDYVQEVFGNDPAYDVDLYLDDINAPMRAGYDKIRASSNWGDNYGKDTKDSIKLAQLYRNATQRAQSLNLAPEFVGFLEEWAKFRDEVSADQAADGGVDQ